MVCKGTLQKIYLALPTPSLFFFKTKGKRNLSRPAEYVPVAFKYQEIKIETGVRGYLAVPVEPFGNHLYYNSFQKTRKGWVKLNISFEGFPYRANLSHKVGILVLPSAS